MVMVQFTTFIKVAPTALTVEAWVLADGTASIASEEREGRFTHRLFASGHSTSRAKQTTLPVLESLLLGYCGKDPLPGNDM
mmetsp:Transcript_16893/g.32996  ORF Transcript_16893/g.32996 Transcript_16893/m.32996 type:complete len:81 (+) Transcript_16893:463-705(+)